MPIIEPRMLGLLPDDKTKSTFWVADNSNVERRVFDTDGNLFTPDGSTVDDRLNAVEAGIPPLDDARIVALEDAMLIAQGDIAVIEGDIVTAEADIDALEVTVGAEQLLLDQAQADIVNIQGDIVTITADVLTASGNSTTAIDGLAAHIADVANPHVVTRAQIGAEAAGTAASAIATHVALSDPHTQYLKESATASEVEALPLNDTNNYFDGATIGDQMQEAGAHINSTSNPHSVTKAQVGLGNVDNISRASLFTSPTFTGTPVAPTAVVGTDTTQIATTEFVNDSIGAIAGANIPIVDSGTYFPTDNVEAALQSVGAQLAQMEQYHSSRLRPYYVEGMGIFSEYCGGVPSGIANYAGGNAYWGVTGTVGDTFVTVASGTFADAGGIWGAVIIDDDGTCHMHLVTGNDGVNKLNIIPALSATISAGEIGNLHDSSLGQHYTSRGYKALAQHLYNYTPKYAERNTYLSKFRATDTSGWTKIGGPFTTYNSAANISVSPLSGFGSKGLSVYCYANGTTQGVKISANVSGKSGFVEFRLAKKSANLNTVTVEYYLDDVLQSTSSGHGTKADYFTFDFVNATTAEVRAFITNCSAVSEFRISDTTWWENEITNDVKMFHDKSSIVFMGDSWGTFHSESLTAELRRLLLSDNGYPARVINHSVAGYTSKYALAWFHDYVVKENPTHVIIEYFVNDYNSWQGANYTTFLDPYNVSVDLDIASIAEWRENIRKLCELAISCNVQPIVLCPCATESLGQTQGLCDSSLYLLEGTITT